MNQLEKQDQNIKESPIENISEEKPKGELELLQPEDPKDINDIFQVLEDEKIPLPEKKRFLTAIIRSQTEYEGPIPPASEFEKYGAVLQDAPERILAMAENQAKHRIDVEKSAAQGTLSQGRLSIWIAAVITVLFLATICFLAYINSQYVAGILAGTTFIAVISYFLRHLKSKSKKNKK